MASFRKMGKSGEEFFAHRDLEKNLGMEPSMNCDRLTVKIPQCQIGFAKYVVHDLYTQLEKIVPKAGEFLLSNLVINQANGNHYW